MNLPTASQLNRTIACPASCVLPHSPDIDSDAARAGRERHARVADVLSGRAPRESIPWPVHDVLGIAEADVVAVERAFRLDVDRGVAAHLGDDIGRAYPPREPGMIDGTADVVVTHADGRTLVVDWKGRSGAAPVRENWQLRTLATMAGADVAAIVALDGDDYTIEASELTPADHEETLDQLRAMVAAIDDLDARGRVTRADVHPSEETCRYCPCKPACPAFAESHAELALAVAEPAWLDRVNAELATSDGIGRWYEWSKRAAEVLGAIDGAIRARLADGPGVLPDGRSLALVSYERRQLDGRIALRVLRELYGEAADGAASVAIGAAEAVAAASAPRGHGAAAKRALVAALADAGAISTTTASKIVAGKAAAQ